MKNFGGQYHQEQRKRNWLNNDIKDFNETNTGVLNND